MKRRKMAFTPAVDGLEKREVLSAASVASIAAAKVTANYHGGGHNAYRIPFVFAPPGVWQNAINFTSNTFHEVLGQLDTFAKNVAKYQYGYPNGAYYGYHVNNALSNIAGRVPYGRANLLPVWQDTLANNTWIGSALHEMKGELIQYLNSNVGINFNVLKSGRSWSSDGHLVFNGKVGQTPTRAPWYPVHPVYPVHPGPLG